MENIAFAHRAMGTMRAQTLFDDGAPKSLARQGFLTNVDIFRTAEMKKRLRARSALLGTTSLNVATWKAPKTFERPVV